jgi:hypothetical protein
MVLRLDSILSCSGFDSSMLSAPGSGVCHALSQRGRIETSLASGDGGMPRCRAATDAPTARPSVAADV